MEVETHFAASAGCKGANSRSLRVCCLPGITLNFLKWLPNTAGNFENSLLTVVNWYFVFGVVSGEATAFYCIAFQFSMRLTSASKLISN